MAPNWAGPPAAANPAPSGFLIAATLPFPRALRPRALPLTLSGTAAEALLVVGLVTVGLLVRWPHLFTSPPLPSVRQTVLAAIAVSEGQAWPLADQAPYLGAPFVYLLAAGYRLVGPSLEATMLLTWVLGALAIVPAYFLGRELAGPAAGAIAGGLMATSPAHTVVSSHVPWVHSLTPLLATASLCLLVRACKRNEPRSLFIAGLLIGLTLQTHPTSLPLLLGAGAVTVAAMRLWKRLPLAALFLACVILGYGTLLVHHVQTRFEVVGDIDSKKERYLDADMDLDERVEQGVYLNNLEQLAASLTRLTAGELREKHESAGSYLSDPRLVLYPVLGILGLVVAPRRLGLVMLAGLVAAVLLSPLLNGKYKPILDGRYLMPLVPVVFVGIGSLIASIGRRPGQRLQPLLALVLAVLTAGLLVSPLTRLDDFYEESTEDGHSNQLYLHSLGRIRAERKADEVVWLDPRLREVKTQAGDTAGSTFAWLLPISGIPIATQTQDAYSATTRGDLLIVHRSTANELRQQVKIEYLDGFSATGKDSPSYRVIRAKSPAS